MVEGRALALKAQIVHHGLIGLVGLQARLVEHIQVRVNGRGGRQRL